jgi:TonB-linked SusC/RagA family outer membrane protein
MMKHVNRALALASVVLGLIPAALHAQGTIVSGHVRTDAGTPLQSVNVSIPTLRLGGNTDAEGRYSFTVPTGLVPAGRTVALTARRIGYAPRSATIDLSGPTVTHDFTLAQSATQLEGVVVTALGIEKSKKALGVAQQTIDSTILTQGARSQNLVADLSGKIAGISVTGATTQGGSARIVIRGANSINGNNQPLFVVDGIPIDNSSANREQARQGYGGYDLGNTAQDLNPDDVESMSVLKGPNAAALYGARAANGAIIITTKKGTGARGFSVSGSSTMTFESPLRLPEYQNTWGQGFQGDMCNAWNSGQPHTVLGWNAGNPNDPSGGPVPVGFDYATCGFSYVDGNYGGVNDGVDESWGPRLDGTPRMQYSYTTPGGAELRPWVAHPENIEGFFKTGKTFTTNGAAQGSNDRANFRLSLTRQDVDGMVPSNTFARTTAGLNAGARVTPKLSTDATIQYIQNQGNNRPGTGYDEANPMMGFIWFGRQVDVATLKNNFVDPDGNQISWNYSYHNNPWWGPRMNHNNDQRDRILGNVAATYRFNDWLRVTGRSGTDFYRNFNTYQFANGWIGGLFDGDYSRGGFQETTRFMQETNSDILVTGNRNLLSNLGLTVNLGGNRRVNRERRNNFGTDQLVIPGIYNISNSAKTVTPAEFTSEKRINSLYGQAEFAYNDYLFVNVTGRNDWSSTLPAGSNSYFYPSVSGSYVFTQALPFNMGGALNYGKIRAGWSRVGNDADAYQLAATYQALTQFGGISRLTVPNALLNPTLKPENTDAWEVGTEMQWFDDRAGIDLSYYSKKTSNQIMNSDVSKASGYTSALVNAGVISNKGIEAALSLTPIRPQMTNGFGWDVRLNFGKNKSKVEQLYGNLQTINLLGGTANHWGLTVEARKGYPYGAMFGVGYLRCGPYDPNSTTDPIEKARLAALAAATVGCPTDGSAQGQILLTNGVPLKEPSSAKRVLGSYTPNWTGGIDNTLHFRGVDFGFLFDTRQGGNVYSTGQMWGNYAGILKTTEFRPDTGLLIAGIDKATGAANTKHVRAEDYWHGLYGNQEAWIYDASFVKLREARLAFNIPKRYLTTTRITNARLSFVGRNLMLWSDMPNVDPETAFSTSNFQGIEMGQLPTARSVGFQLTVTP